MCDILPKFVDTPMMRQTHGTIACSIGINLTADDVDTIADAIDGQRRAHWIVDTAKFKAVRAVAPHLPAPLRRHATKTLAGH